MTNVNNLAAADRAVKSEAQLLLDELVATEHKLIKQGKVNSLNASISASASHLGVVLARIDDPSLQKEAMEGAILLMVKTIKRQMEGGAAGGAYCVDLGGKDA